MSELNNKKEGRIAKLLIIVIIPWIILAVIFGLFDLEISNAVVDSESIWGNFGADFGEGPGYGLIAIALAILIGTPIANIRRQKIPAGVISAVGMGIMIYGLVGDFQKVAIDGGSITISLILFSALNFNDDWQEYKRIALVIVLLAILNPLLFVQLLKFLCGRVRYRTLLDLGFDHYTPWYLPPGPSTKHVSFPSGHTAMGWIFLPLLIAVKDCRWKGPIRLITTTLIFGWGLFVAMSRVMVGAHFASDVLFPTGTAAIFTILLYKMVYLRSKNQDDSVTT